MSLDLKLIPSFLYKGTRTKQMNTILAIKSALVSTVLMTVLAVSGYVLSIGDVSALDYKALVNIGVMSLLTGIVSYIKQYLTTPAGNFAGVVKVK